MKKEKKKKYVRPVADREREALQWAINYFRNCAADLKPDGSQRKFNESTKQMWEDLADEGPEALHRELAAYMDELRRGKDYSFELFYLAATLIERGDPLPVPLRPYIADFLRNPKMQTKRRVGRKASALEWRNSYMEDALSQIVLRWNLPATRNPATTERASAASIVQQAMVEGANYRLSESGINKMCGGLTDMDKVRESLRDDFWEFYDRLSGNKE
jgi:hypothetical protein